MTLHDPLGSSAARVRERAEAYARERRYRALMDRPTTRVRVATMLGVTLMAAATWIHALGCRMADACSCGCGDARPLAECR